LITAIILLAMRDINKVTSNSVGFSTAGYTMIETMISLFLLTTALLGLASLYALSLKSFHGTTLHDLATLQGLEMVERIRANPSAVDAGTYLGLSGEPSGTDCTTAHCSPENMAKFDFREWNQQNSIMLPSGNGDITNPTGSLYMITISWNDGDTTPSYSLTFFPRQ